MLTANFFWSLSGLLLAAVSLIILRRDVKHGRIYMIGGIGETDAQKEVLWREESPRLFKFTVWGVVICAAITFVICLAAAIGAAAASINFLEGADSRLVLLAFVPYSLVLIYVLSNISVKVFDRFWDR